MAYKGMRKGSLVQVHNEKSGQYGKKGIIQEMKYLQGAEGGIMVMVKFGRFPFNYTHTFYARELMMVEEE